MANFLLKSAKEAKSNQGNPFIISGENGVPGKYKLQIARCTESESYQGIGYFAVDFLVKDSDVAQRPAGMLVSTVQTASNQSAPGNVKHFLEAATGLQLSTLSTDEYTELVEKVTGEEQMLAGKCLDCIAVAAIAKKTGKPFTKLTFSRPVPGTEPGKGIPPAGKRAA